VNGVEASGHGFSRAVKRTKKFFLSAEGWRAADGEAQLP
jgi:hypothetical protein